MEKKTKPEVDKIERALKGEVCEVSALDNVAKHTPCEVVELTTLTGKLPKLVLLTSVGPSTFSKYMRLLSYLDYKGEFKEAAIDVPMDFKLKVLSGEQGKKMSEKWKGYNDKPDWEVALSVVCPKKKRPRRTSLHTLATILGRTDIVALAKEMEASGKVVGYRCPDVKCLIFYLKSMIDRPGMIDTRDSNVWKTVEPFLVEQPWPAVKGFKRFANGGTWSGGGYGQGKFTADSSGMPVPYEEEDWDLARDIIKALKAAGFTPGIEEVNGKIVVVEAKAAVNPLPIVEVSVTPATVDAPVSYGAFKAEKTARDELGRFTSPEKETVNQPEV